MSDHFDPSTLRLSASDVTLLQSMGDDADCASLVLYSGEAAGTRHALADGLTVIGRDPLCVLRLDSPGLSRRHAELDVAGDSVVLRDLGAVNGVFVNESRLRAPVALRDGDLLRLGKVLFKFYRRGSLDALLHDRLVRMATIDDGTDVFCKRYLMQALDRDVERARRDGRPLSVVCLDLDHFKAVNDCYGHNAGDAVLRGIAAAVRAAVRAGDIFGRIGGEEFAVVLPDTALAAAVDLANRYRIAVEAAVFDLQPAGGPAGGGTRRHRQTASLGVAQFDAAMAGSRCLLGAADRMLYAAKRAGRNCVRG